MQKNKTYQRNLKIPAILLICLGISATSLAQPMDKQVAQASFPVNMKGVAKDLNSSFFNVDIRPSYDSSKLTVTIENPNGRKLYMRITSPSNGEVYGQYIPEKEYRKRFDFSQAEDGVYTLIITDRNKTKLIKQININTITEEVTRKMEILEIQ